MPVLVLVKVMMELVQTVSFGDMVKSVTGVVLTTMGTTALADMPQGFCAVRLAWNEFGKEVTPSLLVVPHELVANKWVTEGGGGWLNVWGGVPSLKVTVYMVPGVLFSVPVIGKVIGKGPHPLVFPGEPIPIAGVLPKNTE